MLLTEIIVLLVFCVQAAKQQKKSKKQNALLAKGLIHVIKIAQLNVQRSFGSNLPTSVFH